MVGDPSPPGGGGGEGTSTRRVLLGELLVESKVITPEQLGEVLASPREAGKKLGQVLLERGWITEAQLTQTLSLQLSVPWVSLYHIDFSRQLLNRVSRDVAESYCLIPIFVRHVKGQGETLYVAMDDPTNEQALVDVSRLAGLPTKPMIASASDIRSAIRVYYGDPLSQQVIDVPAPPTRLDPPVTAREGKAQSVRDAAPPTPAAATLPDPPRSNPPPPPQSKPPPPPPIHQQTAASIEELGPVTARSYPPPPGEIKEKGVAPAPSGATPVQEEAPAPVPVAARTTDTEREMKRQRMARLLNLTLLDGTTISLPAKKKKAERGPSEGLTARDFVSALRATAHGADASEILGDQVKWEPVVAALLSILLRKGLIADWEFVEELRKI